MGRIVHKDKDWKGLHEPIIPRGLWDQVQEAINTQERQNQYHWDQPHLLKGKLRTLEDFEMIQIAMTNLMLHRLQPG